VLQFTKSTTGFSDVLDRNPDIALGIVIVADLKIVGAVRSLDRGNAQALGDELAREAGNRRLHSRGFLRNDWVVHAARQ
jgi:hypothetical protein